MAVAPQHVVRKRFNALTRESYVDGAPTSAHVGQELIENDRWLTTQLRRTVFCQGFPIAQPMTLPQRTTWFLPPPVEHFVTPGTRNAKLVITASIPAAARIVVKVWTNTEPRFAVGEGEAEDRFRGGTTFDIIGDGTERTHTHTGQANAGDEMLFPLQSGSLESIQFGFRNLSRGDAANVAAVVTSRIISIDDGGGIVTVQNNALAGLPADLNGYTYSIHDTNEDPDEVVILRNDALSCDQDDLFKPARRIWNRRLLQGMDAKSAMDLLIYGAQAVSVQSISAFEHVRREVP